MVGLIRTVFYFGPLIFAFGFLAPLIIQSLSAFGVENVFGASTLLVGLVSAGVLGLLAQIRGRWI